MQQMVEIHITLNVFKYYYIFCNRIVKTVTRDILYMCYRNHFSCIPK